MALLPKPYQVGQDISHLEHVRSLGPSIGIALSKAARAEGNLSLPTEGENKNPSVLRRFAIKPKAPSIQVPKPRLAALRPRNG